MKKFVLALMANLLVFPAFAKDASTEKESPEAKMFRMVDLVVKSTLVNPKFGKHEVADSQIQVRFNPEIYANDSEDEFCVIESQHTSSLVDPIECTIDSWGRVVVDTDDFNDLIGLNVRHTESDSSRLRRAKNLLRNDPERNEFVELNVSLLGLENYKYIVNPDNTFEKLIIDIDYGDIEIY